jgi:hypothetical protein
MRSHGGRPTVVADDLYPCGRVDHQNLALPIELERGRAHDQDYAFGNGAFERNNGLAGLAEPHVIGKERALFRQKKRNSMVRVEQTREDRGETLGCGMDTCFIVRVL